MSARSVLRVAVGVAFAAAFATVSSSQTTQDPPDKDKEKTKTTTTTTTQTQSAPGMSANMAMDKLPLRLRAFAINTNLPAGAGTGAGTLDIVIDRWSTDAEVAHLKDVLKEQGGQDALLKAVQKIKPRAGFIRSSTSLGWDIQFARETMLPDGGRRILVGTDRPMSFWEMSARPRSSDYEFMLAEIHIDKDGKGEGKLAPAASVTYDEDTNTIEIENYEVTPVTLSRVDVVKSGK